MLLEENPPMTGHVARPMKQRSMNSSTRRLRRRDRGTPMRRRRALPPTCGRSTSWIPFATPEWMRSRSGRRPGFSRFDADRFRASRPANLRRRGRRIHTQPQPRERRSVGRRKARHAVARDPLPGETARAMGDRPRSRLGALQSRDRQALVEPDAPSTPNRSRPVGRASPPGDDSKCSGASRGGPETSRSRWPVDELTTHPVGLARSAAIVGIASGLRHTRYGFARLAQVSGAA
jgi:hypothetical protein